MSDRERLIGRIRQVRRLAAVRDRESDDRSESQPDRLESLEARVAHLEQELEGLQDSFHRESERHAKLIAELENRIQPGAMSTALAENARNRGL